jgi:hypothetical protein
MSFVETLTNFFATIGNFFVEHENDFARALKKIEPFLEQALPIVSSIAVVAGAVASSDIGRRGEIIGKVGDYLKTVADEGIKVEAFIQKNADIPLPNLLHNAAVFALSFTSKGAGAYLKDLDLAVQLAYNLHTEQAQIGGAGKVSDIA